nr:pta [Aeromicrobium sp.]
MPGRSGQPAPERDRQKLVNLDTLKGMYEAQSNDAGTAAMVTAAAPFVVAFGDTSDPRVREAVAAVAADGLIRPLFVLGAGDPAAPSGVESVAAEPGESALAGLARVVAHGAADAGVAGSLSSSAAVIRAGISGLRRRGLVCGSFLMDVGGVRTSYADCSVVPDPTDEQLAEIAMAAADHHRACTGDEPRVGMLSFSTAGSAHHPAVVKVRRATEILRSRRPDLAVEGEIQFDVAVDVAVGTRKLPGSLVAGRANVLVFPSLDAGNIAYKVAERVGGARALGSFVLNLSKPWVDLSRGCSTRDLAETVRVLAALNPTSPPAPRQEKETARP